MLGRGAHIKKEGYIGQARSVNSILQGSLLSLLFVFFVRFRQDDGQWALQREAQRHSNALQFGCDKFATHLRI